MPSGTTNDLVSVWGSNASDLWVVGVGGVIQHGNGSNWTASNSGTTADLIGIWGSDSGNVWTVGEGGTILHYQP